MLSYLPVKFAFYLFIFLKKSSLFLNAGIELATGELKRKIEIDNWKENQWGNVLLLGKKSNRNEEKMKEK